MNDEQQRPMGTFSRTVGNPYDPNDHRNQHGDESFGGMSAGRVERDAAVAGEGFHTVHIDMLMRRAHEQGQARGHVDAEFEFSRERPEIWQRGYLAGAEQGAEVQLAAFDGVLSELGAAHQRLVDVLADQQPESEDAKGKGNAKPATPKQVREAAELVASALERIAGGWPGGFVPEPENERPRAGHLR